MLTTFMLVDSALFTGPASFSNRSLRGAEKEKEEEDEKEHKAGPFQWQIQDFP